MEKIPKKRLCPSCESTDIKKLENGYSCNNCDSKFNNPRETTVKFNKGKEGFRRGF